MIRKDFVRLFNKLIRNRSEKWLPEESTEENFLGVMTCRIIEHTNEIMNVLKEEK